MWRYSALVNDGIVEKVFIEEPFLQNSKEDPFSVSDADNMLNYLKYTKIWKIKLIN